MSLVRAAAKSLFAAGSALFPRPGGPRLLIYHQVGAGLGRQMEVETADFRRQLDLLAHRMTVVGIDEALRRWEEPGSDRLAVLTFDDGYRDLYETAFPIMAERGVPFTVYVATAAVEAGVPFDGVAGADPLTWDQLKEMAEWGATVGAHTHTHPDMRHVHGGMAREEIERSNELIRKRLGLVPRHFAYPYGYWSPSADVAVRESYDSAVLGGMSVRSRRGFDPHLIHRFPIQLSDGLTFFGARLENGLVVEETVRRALKGYSGP